MIVNVTLWGPKHYKLTAAFFVSLISYAAVDDRFTAVI